MGRNLLCFASAIPSSFPALFFSSSLSLAFLFSRKEEGDGRVGGKEGLGDGDVLRERGGERKKVTSDEAAVPPRARVWCWEVGGWGGGGDCTTEALGPASLSLSPLSPSAA